MKWFRNFLTKLRAKPEPELPDNWRELDNSTKFYWLKKKGCLVCLHNPKFEHKPGPCGGMSQNMWCARCDTRWNITMFSATEGMAELIEERESRNILRKAVEEIDAS